MDIRLRFRDHELEPTNFEQVLSRIQIVTTALAEVESSINRWYAHGQSLEEARLYPVFEDGSRPRPFWPCSNISSEKIRKRHM
jgi:hypothetical protein